MTSQDYIKHSNDIAWRKLDNEAVILHMDTGYYYTLNETATRMWELFTGKNSPREIAKMITDEYSIDEDDATKDLKNLISELKKEDLITIYES